MSSISGEYVRLRPATTGDVARLAAIRATPEVRARWAGDDLEADVRAAVDSDDLHFWSIEDANGELIGAIQWEEEDDPMYRHASLDLFLDPAVHGQGFGTDAVRALVRHLFAHEGHHRLTIDPAADNAAAIRTYAKVGFREVGILRQYERGPDGRWHDGLLMELLAKDLPR